MLPPPQGSEETRAVMEMKRPTFPPPHNPAESSSKRPTVLRESLMSEHGTTMVMKSCLVKMVESDARAKKKSSHQPNLKTCQTRKGCKQSTRPTNRTERTSFVWLWVTGMSRRAIAVKAGVSVTTVCRWIQRWRREGHVERRPCRRNPVVNCQRYTYNMCSFLFGGQWIPPYHCFMLWFQP